MSNQFRDYTPPDPFSFGTTAKLQQQIRSEKESEKKEQEKNDEK